MKYFWLNINTGEMSDGFTEQDVIKYLDEEILAIATKNGFKLIKYECVNDENFEFYSRMAITTKKVKNGKI